MSIGIWQLVLIVLIILLVFGAGKLPRVMGDIGKGARALKKGLKEEDDESDTPKSSADAKTIDVTHSSTVSNSEKSKASE